MLRAALGRLLQGLAMMAVAASLCFAAQHALPGDAGLEVAAARSGEALTDAGIARATRDGGFDRPLAAQFAAWAGRLLRLDLGSSLLTRRPVLVELAAHAGVTLRIGAMAVLVGLVIALPAGLAAGLRPGSAVDAAVAAAAAAISALPAFLVGLLLVDLFAIRLGWLPAAGSSSALHLVLPTLTLALGFAAPMARIVRQAVREAWGAFPVTFAALKGLTPFRAGLRHGARNAAIPVAVATFLRVAAVFEGFVVIETLFNIPGLGELLVKSLIGRDIPVVQGVALLFGLLYAVLGLAIDAACLALDPRRRLRAARP